MAVVKYFIIITIIITAYIRAIHIPVCHSYFFRCFRRKEEGWMRSQLVESDITRARNGLCSRHYLLLVEVTAFMHLVQQMYLSARYIKVHSVFLKCILE